MRWYIKSVSLNDTLSKRESKLYFVFFFFLFPFYLRCPKIRKEELFFSSFLCISVIYLFLFIRLCIKFERWVSFRYQKKKAKHKINVFDCRYICLMSHFCFFSRKHCICFTISFSFYNLIISNVQCSFLPVLDRSNHNRD